MKKLITLIFLLIGLCMNAQTLKTYSGAYPNMFDSYPKEGRATYTYKDAGNGERIFQGAFKYSDKDNTLSGNFNNNVQDGVWTLIENKIDHNIKTTITFAKGVVSGPIIVEKVYTKCGKQKVFGLTVDINKGHRVGEKTTLFKTQIKDGHLYGSIYYDSSTRVKKQPIKGAFDEYGNPSGTWTSNSPTVQTIEEYTDNGTIICSKYNTATGDRYNSDTSPYMASTVISFANSVIKRLSFRDTPQNEIQDIHYIDEFVEGVVNDQKVKIFRDEDSRKAFYRLPYKYSIIEVEYDKDSVNDGSETLINDFCVYLLNYKGIQSGKQVIYITIVDEDITRISYTKDRKIRAEGDFIEYLKDYERYKANYVNSGKKSFELSVNFISPYLQNTSGMENRIIIKDSELDAEKEQLSKWENEGFPMFPAYSEDEHLTPVSLACNPNYIKSDLNDYEEYIMPYRKYDDRINYKNENGFGTSYLYFNVDRDGVITNEKVSGPLSKVLKPSKYFSVNKPALYHFERLDSTISVPCSVKIPIEEVGLKIADGWIDLKYNKKKNTWKVKSLNDIYIPKDLIPTIEEYFQFIPEDMDEGVNYREGKHRLHIGVFKHKAIVSLENEIDLNPVVIIFSK